MPRTNRGIFAINELPDLQPRIQVGLLNILEEKDIQIRGFPVRLPLDMAIVYSANPEDYTNRGNIITPLKDRIDSQIMTHYPEDLQASMAITSQEAWIERESPARAILPDYIREIIEEIAFQARQSEYVDQNSGVSARLPITALEIVLSNMERRALRTGDNPVHARVGDLQAAVTALTGKIELVYEGEQEGPIKVARYLIGRAVKSVFEAHFPGAHRGRSREKEEVATSPYRQVVEWFSQGKQARDRRRGAGGRVLRHPRQRQGPQGNRREVREERRPRSAGPGHGTDPRRAPPERDPGQGGGRRPGDLPGHVPDDAPEPERKVGEPARDCRPARGRPVGPPTRNRRR